MKRILCAVIALAFMLAAAVIPAASAAVGSGRAVTVMTGAGQNDQSDLIFVVQNAQEKRISGLTVPVGIELTRNTGYISGLLQITWDHAALALRSVAYSAIAPMNTAVLDPDDPDTPAIENTGSYRIYLGDHITQGLENFAATGAALMLTFEILNGAAAAGYPIAVSGAEFQQTDLDADDLTVDAVTGSITLTPCTLLRGDAGFDGVVNIFDASAIQKGLVGMPGYPDYRTMQRAADAYRTADADGDGYVAIYDAALIQRWRAGFRSAREYGIGDRMD